MSDAVIMCLLATGVLIWRYRIKARRATFQQSRKKLDAERLFKV